MDEKQFVGGTFLDGESRTEVCADRRCSALNSEQPAMAAAQGREHALVRVPGHTELREPATCSTPKCATLAAQRQKDVSLRVVGIKLDAEGWVKNVLIPALIDEFIKENGDPR